MIALDIFNSGNLFKATENLFAQLNIKLNSNTEQAFEAKAILNDFYKDRTPYTCINQVYFLGNIDDSVFENSIFNGYSFEEAKQQANNNYNGLMLFALELSKHPTRTEISELTRAFNRISQKMPVALLLRYEHFISVAISERFLYKQEWRQGEKVGKIIILRDINTQKTHEGHRRILQDLANHNAKNFNELHKVWLKVLNIQTLNKNFYERLVKWYELCFNDIKIDLRAASRILGKKIEDELKPQAVIRVIIRMMFIWFMKEKGLLPDKFFNKEYAKQFLKSENTYYNATLQNLFFAVLNKKIDERRFRKHNPQNRYDAESNDYGISDVFRYKDFFKDENKANDFVNQTKTIPFINGGLFQCHDYKFAGKDTVNNEKNTANNYIIDGFSDNKGEMAKISDGVIFELIGLFNDYVWTIEESTPTEQDIALDPELLGTIFENLIGFYNPETKENARKQTGSFYTPREIVEYMCTESLKEALKTKFPNLHTQIDELIEKNEDQLNFPDKTKMLAAITDLKILDPACGSGAFPMGMFMLMVRTIEKLQEHKTTYKNKLDIITNCIYGIDIQNIAIEISKLRFFISLLVDYQTPEHIEDFEVLPNLETKFVVANTLIDIDLKKSKNPLFEQELLNKCNELTKIFIPFTQAKTPKEKADIKNAFSEKKQELTALLKENNFGGDDVNKIADWNPFNVCYCSPFFDKTVMFGLKDGFDVVIGNPPYVSAPTMVETNPKVREAFVSSKNFTTLYQKWDLYIPFMELGLQLLTEKGIFTMIVPYPLTNQTYAKKIRELIVKSYNLIEIVDLNGTKVFENATVSNCIPFVTKSKSNNSCYISHIDEQKQISRTFRQTYSDLVQDEKTSVWNLTTNKRETSRHSEMNVLGDFCYISKGMVLNSDEKTAKREFSKDDLISETHDAVHCRKYIEAKDIEKYRVKKTRYLEYNTERCPNKLSRPTFRELYDNPKLMFNRLGDLMVFYDEDTKFLHSDSMFSAVLWKNLKNIDNKSIKASVKRYSRYSRKEMELYSKQVDLRYLLGILNSKYASVLLSNLRGGDYHIYPEHLRNMPIPLLSKEQQQPLIALVNQILSAKKENPVADTRKLEREIDGLVYGLYGLTEEEIGIIENKST